MFRPLTFITLAMACGSGLYLYQVKHQAQVLDRQIERTVKATEATRAQARELNAAWTLLGNPGRLQQLADQYLTIEPVRPNQFVSLADLDARLPPPRPLDATPDATPDGTPDATPGAPPSDAAPADAAPKAAPIVAAAPTAKPDAPSTAAAATEPSRAAPVESAKLAAPTAVRPAERKPTEPPRQTRDAWPPRAVTPRPARTPEIAQLDHAAPARALPPVAPEPITGSLLGMAHGGTTAVPPPRPLPVSNAPGGAWSN